VGAPIFQGCNVMTDTIIMRGAYAITDPRLGASGVIPAGAVVIMDGTVKETGPFAAIAPKFPVPTLSVTAPNYCFPGWSTQLGLWRAVHEGPLR
jgi:hypothetical protein